MEEKKRKVEIEIDEKSVEVEEYRLVFVEYFKNANRVTWNYHNFSGDAQKVKSNLLQKGKDYLRGLLHGYETSETKKFYSQNFKQNEGSQHQHSKESAIDIIVSRFFDEKSNFKKRESEKKNLETVSIHDLEFVLSGIFVPLEVAEEILSFFDFSLDLIASVGAVNSNWYLLILFSWNRYRIVSVASRNIYKLSLIILRNLRVIKSAGKFVTKDTKFFMKHITFTKIAKINFKTSTSVDVIQRLFIYWFDNKVKFPNCHTLKMPNHMKSSQERTLTAFNLDFSVFLPNLTNFSMGHTITGFFYTGLKIKTFSFGFPTNKLDVLEKILVDGDLVETLKIYNFGCHMDREHRRFFRYDNNNISLETFNALLDRFPSIKTLKFVESNFSFDHMKMLLSAIKDDEFEGIKLSNSKEAPSWTGYYTSNVTDEEKTTFSNKLNVKHRLDLSNFAPFFTIRMLEPERTLKGLEFDVLFLQERYWGGEEQEEEKEEIRKNISLLLERLFEKEGNIADYARCSISTCMRKGAFKVGVTLDKKYRVIRIEYTKPKVGHRYGWYGQIKGRSLEESLLVKFFLENETFFQFLAKGKFRRVELMFERELKDKNERKVLSQFYKIFKRYGYPATDLKREKDYESGSRHFFNRRGK